VKLGILIFVGYHTFFIFGEVGVVISLVIISFTGLFSLVMIAKNTWMTKSRDFMENLEQFAIISGIVGYIFFIPWKSTYCYEFGVKEIGSYFEKDTYEAKYIVEISRTTGSAEYKLPAEILVSDDFSQFEYYASETGTGAYSDETMESSEIRFAKINRVFFANGGFLVFENCFAPINEWKDCSCYDQSGTEWSIVVTTEKAK